MDFVYFNLHKKMWSVKDLKTGRVRAHTHLITLQNVEFKVSQAGRNRVISEKRKNVHAGVKGTEFDGNCFLKDKMTEVTYNPYKFSSFVVKATEEPVVSADLVVMENGRVFAWGIKYV